MSEIWKRGMRERSGGVGVTTEERQSIIIATIALLDQSTSNSLDPVHRASWIEDRDYLAEKLKELLP